MFGRAFLPALVALVVPGVALAQSPFSSTASATSTSSQATPPPAPPRPPPGRAPERCGMTETTADYGELVVGSVVTLQRHRLVRGDDNWDVAMERYLGRAAHVTRLSGVDEQGCAGVRVDVDGGTRFWRVRDLGIGTDLQPLPAEVTPSDAFPQSCHQSEMAPNYGAATVGATVVLGRHRIFEGDTNWADDMAQFVGRTAHVMQPGGLDAEGCPGVRVDIDGQAWFWRVRDLSPAGSGDSFDPSTTYTPSLGVTTDHGRPPVSIGIFGSGGTPGPQACGLSDGQVVWDPIALGAEVTLGQHREVNGDTNWADEMSPYVGQVAHITELVGVDEQGCPIVHVDADGGGFYWRVRDMTVLQGGTAPTTPSWSGIQSWPTACGQATAAYGPITMGSRIILGAHTPYTGPDGQGSFVQADDNWNEEMSQYVGQLATVIQLDGLDEAGCSVVHVDIDGGAWYWRLRDAHPAP